MMHNLPFPLMWMASYTLARRKSGGSMPNYAGVQAEFINYFDYHYDSSNLTASNPFVVDMEMMPHPLKETDISCWTSGMEHTVESAARWYFLVDVSGSMSSADKLQWPRNPCTCLSIHCEKMIPSHWLYAQQHLQDSRADL